MNSCAESANSCGRLPVTDRGEGPRKWCRGGKEEGRGKKDARKEEWMNRFRNGTLKTVKLLNNLADAADVCVRMCARLCCLFVPRL